MLYAMKGEMSGELITFNGKVLVHNDSAEMEFIFPYGVQVIRCPASISEEDQLDIKYHPDLASVRWPIRRSDFRGVPR